MGGGWFILKDYTDQSEAMDGYRRALTFGYDDVKLVCRRTVITTTVIAKLVMDPELKRATTVAANSGEGL